MVLIGFQKNFIKNDYSIDLAYYYPIMEANRVPGMTIFDVNSGEFDKSSRVRT